MLKTLFLVSWEMIKLGFKTALSIFPIYQQLSSFKQDLIATALGISPVVFGLVISAVKILKRVVNKYGR